MPWVCRSGVRRAVAGRFWAKGWEHSGVSGPLQSVVARFGCRAVFLAHGISQKYNYLILEQKVACAEGLAV